jgi:predicted NAD/FAD-binding protein
MRIAVIGAGVSGLGAAWALRETHDVTLYEGQARLGGHANTVRIDYDGAPIDVDTGFIVFNAHNYPNLVGLLQHLNVETHESDMSFAVSDPRGYEWSSNGMGGLFAWKRNITNPAFLCMLGDIVRFSTAARAAIADDRIPNVALEEYVAELRLGRSFLRHYLLPMGAAIWSTPEEDMLKYPAASFLRFFDNHRLLHAKRPTWRTVKGGSQSYVRKVAAALEGRIRQGDPVVDVRRVGEGVVVRTASGSEARYDHAILASHSDETLKILSDANSQERALLSAVRYAPNTAYLHRDASLMPRREAAWASWNYMRGRGRADGSVCVSYWMNLLQDIDRAKPLFVTLNPAEPPKADLTFASFDYSHPQFDLAALEAQKSFATIQGQNHVSFAGAWLGYGFHEDGLASGVDAALRLGGRVPWRAAPVRGSALHPPTEHLSAAAS